MQWLNYFINVASLEMIDVSLFYYKIKMQHQYSVVMRYVMLFLESDCMFLKKY